MTRLTHICPMGRTNRMPGPRPKYAITLTREQEARLQQVSTSYMAPFAVVQRAQIVLSAFRHPEWTNATLAQRVGCNRSTVRRWRRCCRRPGAYRMRPVREHDGDLPPCNGRRWWPWPVVHRVNTASRGSAGQGRSWRAWRSNDSLWSGSRRVRFARGCARIRLSRGAIIRGNIPLIRSLSRRPCRCWTSTSTLRNCKQVENSRSVWTRKPPSRHVNG